MTSRIDYAAAAPGALQAMYALERYVRECGLERPLLELVKLRSSQLNACAYCIDMHSKDALAAGETPQRLLLLDAWREAPFYSARERAALAWTEAVTRIGDAGVSDALRSESRAQFSDRELVDLTMAVIAINGWNRLAIGFGADVGSYQPRTHPAPANAVR
ncbi:MAG TPA: carboxymuconolactone decarboxylase family protein [Gemmatimonadales bacterium]|nr:carboxymuconolactone decarboxylase family protein [Gemmatimonadales bacterium]